MITEQERDFFLRNGYLKVEGALQGDHLSSIQAAFDEVWEKEAGANGRAVYSYQLLKYQPFIDLVEHPPILDRHRAIFGRQAQLVDYALLRQGPHNTTFAERAWHRDFTFPGDLPLAINTIVFLDDITPQAGPTRVVPRTHTGEQYPPHERRNQPLEGEVAVACRAGTAIYINGAIWHTGARNESDGLRRGIYMYYGFWWLKRYYAEHALPWQAVQGAPQQRLELLGVKMPGRDLHMYEPTPSLVGTAS
jgi:ectoine hydroxylase-related dioxygenase (phytanoyl-CoA dioxygenase family)